MCVRLCVRVCVCACVRACVRLFVCVCGAPRALLSINCVGVHKLLSLLYGLMSGGSRRIAFVDKQLGISCAALNHPPTVCSSRLCVCSTPCGRVWRVGLVCYAHVTSLWATLGYVCYTLKCVLWRALPLTHNDQAPSPLRRHSGAVLVVECVCVCVCACVCVCVCVCVSFTQVKGTSVCLTCAVYLGRRPLQAH